MAFRPVVVYTDSVSRRLSKSSRALIIKARRLINTTDEAKKVIKLLQK